MHICTVMSVPYPPVEGIGNYVYGLSRKMIEKGHKVTIITRGSLQQSQREMIEGVEIIRARFAPCYPFHVHFHGFFVNRIFKSMEGSFDVVHLHTPLPPFIKTSLPIVTTFHTPMKADTRSVKVVNIHSLGVKVLARLVSIPLELKLLERANKTAAVATSVAQELSEYGVDPQDVFVVGNGVDEEVFFPSHRIGKMKPGERYILYTGRLGHRKGLFDLIESGKIICQQYPDISFVIPGKGNLASKLQEKVKETGLQDRFKFLGFVEKEELIKLYQNAYIYVIPSHYEGLPTVLLEAMACGCPVVATSVSGNLDVIEHEKNGILVPPKSPKEIAQAISILLDDDAMRCKMGDAARKTIEERFTWDIISDKMLECYESTVEV